METLKDFMAVLHVMQLVCVAIIAITAFCKAVSGKMSAWFVFPAAILMFGWGIYNGPSCDMAYWAVVSAALIIMLIILAASSAKSEGHGGKYAKRALIGLFVLTLLFNIMVPMLYKFYVW
jgi:hypothetical protein